MSKQDKKVRYEGPWPDAKSGHIGFLVTFRLWRRQRTGTVAASTGCFVCLSVAGVPGGQSGAADSCDRCRCILQPFCVLFVSGPLRCLGSRFDILEAGPDQGPVRGLARKRGCRPHWVKDLGSKQKLPFKLPASHKTSSNNKANTAPSDEAQEMRAAKETGCVCFAFHGLDERGTGQSRRGRFLDLYNSRYPRGRRSSEPCGDSWASAACREATASMLLAPRIKAPRLSA